MVFTSLLKADWSFELNQELNRVKPMKATANVVYYTSKTLANGEHPLMIRYCKDGKKKYKSLGVCKIRGELTPDSRFELTP